MHQIDLNCDMGESFGAWTMGNDAALMDYVTSVNIACGFHAGDATTMRRTVEMAIEKGMAIGAHPSYPDLQGFGRRAMSLSAGEIYDLVLYQVSALKGICKALGARLHHVKPHGALYNQSAKDIDIAAAIASAVKSIDGDLILYGLSGSVSIKAAESAELRTASEVFADRTYQSDGSLTPRTRPGALIDDTAAAVAQIMQMIQEGNLTSVDGKTVAIKADTICIHGDGPQAVEFAKAVREALQKESVRIQPI